MNRPGAARRIALRWGPPAALVAVAFALWEGVVRGGVVQPWLVPPPSAIPQALAENAAELLRHTGITLVEVLLGLAISTLVGLLTAVLIVYSPVVERALYPFVVASQTVPLPVLAPLLVIFLGYGIAPKMLLVTLVCFFPIVVNTVDGLRAVEREMLDLLRTFGATRRQIFFAVRWPAALPFFFSGLRVAAAVSVIGAVFGELLGGSAGLGYYVKHETPFFHTAEVYAATFLLALLGVALFLAVRGAEWVLLPWRRRQWTGDRGAL